jgi:hypothetical protein
VRDILHGEHSGHADPDHATQFLVSDEHKYIWYTHSGREQLFDLENDPDELKDLALTEDAENRLQPWRDKMIEFLNGRPEGFTDGKNLLPGRPHDHVFPDYQPDSIYPFL